MLLTEHSEASFNSPPPMNFNLNFHQKSLLIGTVTVALCVAVFLWIVIFNKGTVVFSGEPSYTITITGNPIKGLKTIECSTNSCAVSLPSGLYSATLKKDGYFEMTADFNVIRGGTTPLTATFEFIPTVTEMTANETGMISLPEIENLSARFSLAMDETYKKQRLDYTDPATQETVTWAYFDRPLENALIAAPASLDRALVVDRAQAENMLYLVDHFTSQRTYVGALQNVENALWSFLPNLVLVRTVSTNGEVGLWLVDTDKPSLSELPLSLSFEKVIWDDSNRIIFATQQNVEALESAAYDTPLDALKALLNGDLTEDQNAVFFIGEYDPNTTIYRTLYKAPESLGLNYDNIRMVYVSDASNATTAKIYFTDGVKAYEVVR